MFLAWWIEKQRRNIPHIYTFSLTTRQDRKFIIWLEYIRKLQNQPIQLIEVSQPTDYPVCLGGVTMLTSLAASNPSRGPRLLKFIARVRKWSLAAMQYYHRMIRIGRCVVLQQVAQHGNEAACKRCPHLQGKKIVTFLEYATTAQQIWLTIGTRSIKRFVFSVLGSCWIIFDSETTEGIQTRMSDWEDGNACLHELIPWLCYVLNV